MLPGFREMRNRRGRIARDARADAVSMSVEGCPVQDTLTMPSPTLLKQAHEPQTKPVGNNELIAILSAWQKTNAAVRVFISGDRDARHGDVIKALDLVRSAGIDKVAFEIRPPTKAP